MGPVAVQALVGLGSNLMDPPRQIAAAVAALSELPDSTLRGVARRYWSAPWGPPGQPRYLNSAAVLETTLPVWDLLRSLQGLERRLGKVPPAERYGPRSIDLDLLAYGDLVLQEPELTVPHPRLHERAFVLYPLNDLVPDAWIPGRGRVRDMAAKVDGSGTVPEDSEHSV